MPRKKQPDKPPRRKRNTGSIAAQADGTYWAIPPRWVDAGRKPRRGFRSWQDAAAWLDDACERTRAGDEIPSDITLGEYYVLWFDRVADSAGWSVGTRNSVKSKLRVVDTATDARGRPLGVFDRALPSLRLGHLQDVIAALARRPVAAARIRQIAGLLRRILSAAQDDGLVARNVSAQLVLPKARKSAPRAWTHAEVRRLLAAIEGEPLEPLVLLGLVLGMRIGEILGLAWDEIDFDRNHLTISHSFSNGVLGPTKSRQERTVRMPDRVWAALLRHRENQAPGVPWVFPSRQRHGRPVSYIIARRWLMAMIEAAGIRQLGTHALRHSASTAMLVSGADPADVAATLGHASPATTLGMYYTSLGERGSPTEAADRWIGVDPDSET